MYKIGDFSNIAKTTIKTLRYYEKEGLLKPAYIDLNTGYYESSQLVDISKIINLRQVGLSIKDIKRILDGQNMVEILTKRKEEIEGNLVYYHMELSKINYLLEGDNMKNEVIVKNIPSYIIYYCDGIVSDISLAVVFYFFILFVGAMTSISSSSISLEGKTINITKSLPIKESKILNSKIFTCFVIELPFLLLSDFLFFLKFKPSIFYIFLILLLSLLIIFLNSCIGLIANLKYPKMNATNDTEVVKQSMSSMISVFAGMGILMISILILCFLNTFFSFAILLDFHILLMMIISAILYFLLMKHGTKEYRHIVV